MGRAITEALAGASDLALKASVERGEAIPPGAGRTWSNDLGAAVAGGDVVVEFSTPGVAVAAARLCAERGAALVSGTTGLDADAERAIRDAAARVAVVRAANFSLGVLALRRALEAALAALPPSWDIEIVERHHRGKQDAPSGTALMLGRQAVERRGYAAAALRTGRTGRGLRPREEVAIHSLRGGTWIGDHAVVIAGAGEWLELRHVAEDRAAFANGVLAAARFVAGASPGLYTLEHVAGAAAGAAASG
ncbi:MAG: 4-hydroxy-tetrahydrodipicolinate reductase [Candidatus Eisenbacteria bacterium]|uniref:4-hydroxy-tetrahydrodipicolinate reductase n=1 Tax=Eiseniibacteriota bacterium TaxID=2212470 RepID=A0A9D6LBK9_UNCEI|nr:4-hydroxy-tetrahydrodipicolinate reductase [Candidatus Eisenbacteria bacterium]MBI3539684.1 4-hydroxy-tetrahydrodipicolinate reductase [Candidatus Eisenbacteria bacterium]